MISLKKILMVSSLAAATAGIAGGVADAQPYGHYGRGGYGHRFDGGDRLSTAYVDGLNWRIQNAAREGRIGWREARELQRRLQQVQPIAWRYQTGQARPAEVGRLERTVDFIVSRIRG